VGDNDGPVSIASCGRPTAHGIAVNMVFAPPHLRGRGYAGSCVAALSQRLLDDGWKFCTLFTDLANPTSNSIYQRIGYHSICDFTHYLFQ
jgi:predicted GNAT family acetyltransferase